MLCFYCTTPRAVARTSRSPATQTGGDGGGARSAFGAALLRGWSCSGSPLLASRVARSPGAPDALAAALASFASAADWRAAAAAAGALRAVAAAQPGAVPSYAGAALRDAARAALLAAGEPAARSDVARAAAACVRSLTGFVETHPAVPSAAAALAELLPQLAPSPLLLHDAPLGAACARAVTALRAVDALALCDRATWTPLLLRWATAWRDELDHHCRRSAACDAMNSLASGQDPASAGAAHAWLAALLRALASHCAGWAPRVVADDAAAAATSAASALEGAAAAVLGSPSSCAAPQRRFYGILPPAAAPTPPAPSPPPPPAPALGAAAPPAPAAAPLPALAVGLKALALVLTADPALSQRALACGLLPLLARLTRPAELSESVPMEDEADGEREGGSAPADRTPHTAVQRQLARVVAQLALLPAAAPALREEPFASWLSRVVCDHAAEVAAHPGHAPPLSSASRKLASHARRAMLNAQAACEPGAGEQEEEVGAGVGAGAGAQPGDHCKLSPPRFADGLFFLEPSAGCVTGEGALVDVVFVHGLRGGPYGTWRARPDAHAPPPPPPPPPPPGAGGKATLLAKQRARRRPSRGSTLSVWPADWLAADAPGVRLLSLSFRSRYSDWEGSTAGLEALADAMLEKLTSAGVGQRPLVLVGHSMGGVLIKLMLARATQEPRHAQLAGALRGAVFYSCPHFGSALAALGSWAPKRLLRISPGVADLRPGQPALDSLNQLLRRLHKRPHASVRVLSFLEGAPTKLAELPVPGLKARAIAAEIVAMESAYPGFGELVVLPDSDHIDACKPRSRLDASYARTLALVREVLAEAQAEAQAAQAGKG